MAKAPHKQLLQLPGPAGQLEAMLETPEEATAPARVAVVCHPHPLYQGTMLNKVVHTLARAMNDLGMAALRFNFRGVGASAGEYADGDGEVDDLLAVCDWVRAEWPAAEIWLAGFSFGGVIAARAAAAAEASRLISIAPAVNILGAALAQRPVMPWLIVQGEADDVVPAADVQAFVASCASDGEPAPELVMVPGAGHFFHGHLVDLRRILVERLG
ncbi:MAG: prolyl oligopeptidase family serine peptidase [Gammaproteobacteria bacterium]|nr:prolyl oligopeptidase family serine peptidase [Gammaproteobacteria bacterium]